MPYRYILSRDSTAVLSLTVIWALTALLINPSGNFPLNDDWSYALSLRQWYETHHYHLIGWTSMPLVTQLAWGMIFCKVFGFSFTVLRYSTLVLGLVGGIGAYFLAREFSDRKGICFFVALLLLFNPLYLNLANGFMTDVPFTSFLILSLLFFVKGLRHDRLSYIIQGILFVVLATLVRQLGLLAAAAFSFVLLVKGGINRRSLAIPVISVGIPLAIYLFYNHWIKAQDNLPIKYNEGFARIKNNILGKDHSTFQYLIRQALNIFVYAGFFIFPFIFRTDWAVFQKQLRTYAVLITLAVMIFAGIFCLTSGTNMPLMGNILNPYGLGPLNLRDNILLHSDHVAPLPAMLWVLFCTGGIIGGGFLLLAFFRVAPGLLKKQQAPLLFLLCFMAVYCGMMLIGGTYDRYLIPLVPILVILLVSGLPETDDVSGRGAAGAFGGHALTGGLSIRSRRWLGIGRIAAVLSLAGGAWFSVAGTANYMSWNRARWDALRYLTYDAGIPSSQIDGGFEFNGYYNYSDDDISALKDHPAAATKSWWWVKDDAYQVAFGPVEGYTVLKTFPCRSSLFPFSSEDIYVLKRNQLSFPSSH